MSMFNQFYSDVLQSLMLYRLQAIFDRILQNHKLLIYIVFLI